jgi:hypothetical protein
VVRGQPGIIAPFASSARIFPSFDTVTISGAPSSSRSPATGAVREPFSP